MTINQSYPPQVQANHIHEGKWLLDNDDRMTLKKASSSDAIQNFIKDGHINFDFDLKTKEITPAVYAMIQVPGKYKVIFTDEGHIYIGYKSLGRGSSSVAWLVQDINTSLWYASKFYFGHHKKILFHQKPIEKYLIDIRNRILDYYYEKQKNVLENLDLLVGTISPRQNKEGLHSCGLTMPFYSGKTLGQHMREEGMAFKKEIVGQATSLDSHELLLKKIHVTMRLFESIQSVHEKGTLLIDTNPFNFIYNPELDRVFPVDFNFSINKENDGHYSAAPLIGEFDTMSPELIEQISTRSQYPIKNNDDLKKLMGFNHIYRFYSHSESSETYGYGIIFRDRIFFLDFTESNNNPITSRLKNLSDQLLETNPDKRITLKKAIAELNDILASN